MYICMCATLAPPTRALRVRGFPAGSSRCERVGMAVAPFVAVHAGKRTHTAPVSLPQLLLAQCEPALALHSSRNKKITHTHSLSVSLLCTGAGYHSSSSSSELKAVCSTACREASGGPAQHSLSLSLFLFLLFISLFLQAMVLLEAGHSSSEAVARAISVLEVPPLPISNPCSSLRRTVPSLTPGEGRI